RFVGHDVLCRRVRAKEQPAEQCSESEGPSEGNSGQCLELDLGLIRATGRRQISQRQPIGHSRLFRRSEGIDVVKTPQLLRESQRWQVIATYWSQLPCVQCAPALG